MFNFSRCVWASALVFASVSVNAQEVESSERPDSEFAMPAPAPAQRVMIANDPSDAARDVRQAEQTTARPAEQTRARPADPAEGRSTISRSQRQAGAAPDGQSEFQKFLEESTGKVLPIFGAEFFENAPSTFAPVGNAPVPAEYPLGAGDEVLIRGWGSIDINYRATIDRNGLINIPTVGSVVLAGVKAGDAEGVIRGAIARLYKGVTVSVNFGQLRAITVYVVGQASRPGTYTVSSLSTLVTALFASGGPNANGSMRRVQVKRAGKVAAELDLYAFIAKGDKSADIKLQDGDTIYIPSAIGYVAVIGKVNMPAIYELRGGVDTIAAVLDVAGGLPVVADPRRAFLERIDPTRSQPRTVEQFALDEAGLKRSLKNGDVLNITSITPDFSNAVVLRGNVDQAIRAPFKPGMRVSDLIPSRDYLITRSSTQRQNSAISAGDNDDPTRENAGTIASRIGGLIEEINWDYAVVERVNRADLSVRLIPFNLGKVFTQPTSSDNVQLQPGDTVTIFSQKDVLVPMDKRQVFVRVEGEVNVPGVYQMSSGETLQQLLARAGGPTRNAYVFGVGFYREQVRLEQQANLKKAADKLEAQLRSELSRSAAQLRAVNPGDAEMAALRQQTEQAAAKATVDRMRKLEPTGRIAFGLPAADISFARLPQLKLENGDRLVVPAKPEFVHVFGAVNVEASPLWRPNRTVNDYLELAGPTVEADLANAFILRVDGSVVSGGGKWFLGGFGGVEVMPGDSIVIPEKFDKESRWTKFTRGTREWAQIFANFGLGAAAIKTLRD